MYKSHTEPKELSKFKHILTNVNQYDATDSKTIILNIRAEKTSTTAGDHGSKKAVISRHVTSNEGASVLNNTSEAIH